MSGPPPKICATCGRSLAPGEVYYRFTLVLEGEQDVLGPTPARGDPGDELTALLERLESGSESAEELEAQVHWRHRGLVCAACRTVVMRTLSSPPALAGPH